MLALYFFTCFYNYNYNCNYNYVKKSVGMNNGKFDDEYKINIDKFKSTCNLRYINNIIKLYNLKLHAHLYKGVFRLENNKLIN